MPCKSSTYSGRLGDVYLIGRIYMSASRNEWFAFHSWLRSRPTCMVVQDDWQAHRFSKLRAEMREVAGALISTFDRVRGELAWVYIVVLIGARYETSV
jgi:hypothetical protein